MWQNIKNNKVAQDTKPRWNGSNYRKGWFIISNPNIVLSHFAVSLKTTISMAATSYQMLFIRNSTGFINNDKNLSIDRT